MAAPVKWGSRVARVASSEGVRGPSPGGVSSEAASGDAKSFCGLGYPEPGHASQFLDPTDNLKTVGQVERLPKDREGRGPMVVIGNNRSASNTPWGVGVGKCAWNAQKCRT